MPSPGFEPKPCGIAVSIAAVLHGLGGCKQTRHIASSSKQAIDKVHPCLLLFHLTMWTGWPAIVKGKCQKLCTMRVISIYGTSI
ncbi:hypothetical protein TNCV_1256581 [Trichonephila clavipes]|nr:hypothetical protein TNCV_1256581 [Trichonephila clavipes]